MNRLSTWSVVIAAAVMTASCGKAEKPAKAAAVKVGEAADKAGEAAKAGAAEAMGHATRAAAAAQKIAEVAKAEALKTAKVAADGAEATAHAAKLAAKRTAEAARNAVAGAAPAGAASGAASQVPADWAAVLKDPSKATAIAPAVYKVKFTTTKGDFVMTVHRDWAPKGADRFYNLVKAGFYSDIGFFRNIAGFMVQFGIHGDPNIGRTWSPARLDDDPHTQSNKLGYVTFATSGKDSRTTQIFISYKDNSFLDSMGFTPFAFIDAEGMAVVNKLYKGYGEGAPRGKGPLQGRLQSEGNTYLKAEFPLMDFCKSAVVLDGK